MFLLPQMKHCFTSEVYLTNMYLSQLILSYIFMPVAFMMGVRWDEAGPVGEMLGTKIILNEFVAYRRLADYKAKRLEGADEWLGDSRQWITVSTATVVKLNNFNICNM